MTAADDSLNDEVGALARASSPCFLFLARVGAVQLGREWLARQRPEHLLLMLCQSSWYLLVDVVDLLDDQPLAWLQAIWQLQVDEVSLPLDSCSAQAQQHTMLVTAWGG